MYDLKERKKKKWSEKKNLEYRDQKTNCCDQNDTHIGEKKKGRYVLRNGQVVIFLCRLVGCLNAAAPVGGTHYY